MELAGRSVMVAGTFAGLGDGEARRRLEAAGVTVTEAASPSTTAAFIGEVRGNEVGETYVQGVPIFDGAALLDTLGALEGAEDAHATAGHPLAAERSRTPEPEVSGPFTGRGEVTALALSADGRHLATGTWGGGDSGTLRIWDVAAGRVVNVLDGIDGGIGWWGVADAIQWSGDGEHIGMAFRTNAVGVWDPFGESVEPRAEVQVTDGASRPPKWALHPGGRRAFVSTQMDGAHGCVVPLERGSLFWRPGALASPNEFTLAGPLPPEIEGEATEMWIERARWSPDGTRLHCFGRGGVFAVDGAGVPLWFTRTGQGADWSPDGRFVAYVRRGRLQFLDGATGESVGEPSPVIAKVSGLSLHWAADGRLAAVVSAAGTEPGVHVFDDGDHRHHLPVPSAAEPRDDFAPWAWAPSGDRGAVLTAGGEIQIWAVDEPRLLRRLPAPEGTAGVLWGAGDVVIAAGPSTVRFVATAEASGGRESSS